MKLLKINTLLLLVLNSFISISQNERRIELSPGILKDTNFNPGINLKFTNYLINKPISISVGLSFYRIVNRIGDNSSNYQYYSNQNLVPYLGVNYEILRTKNNINLVFSPRVSYFINSKDFFSSTFNNRNRRIEENDKVVRSNYFSVGTGLNLKKSLNNNFSLLISYGADYLMDKKIRLNQNILFGFEFLVGKSSNKKKESEVKSKLTSNTSIKSSKIEQKELPKEIKDSVVIKQKKKLLMDRIDSVEVVENVKNNVEKKKPIISNLDSNNQTIQSDSKSEEKNIPVIQVYENKVNTKNGEEFIVEPIKIKKEIRKNTINKDSIKRVITSIKTRNQTLNDSLLKTNKSKEIIKAQIINTKKSIHLKDTNKLVQKPLRVLGPLNVKGDQYDLGDDWNYWKGENELWFAQHKDKEKWYDLLKALNEENYEKAKNTLIKAKKVE